MSALGGKLPLAYVILKLVYVVVASFNQASGSKFILVP